jgi:hypothetical protein
MGAVLSNVIAAQLYVAIYALHGSSSLKPDNDTFKAFEGELRRREIRRGK